LTSYKIESLYAFPFYLSIFPTRFQYIDYLMIQVWYPQSRNTIISTVTEHKHLGLQLSDDGNWNKHIVMITKEAFSRVNILRKFKFIRDRKTLETIYITFIRPG
jgi:hypothetical protein